MSISDLPALTMWAERQTSGNAEQTEAFLAACDRWRLARLDEEMRTVGRALREFVRADDELQRRELAGVLDSGHGRETRRAREDDSPPAPRAPAHTFA